MKLQANASQPAAGRQLKRAVIREMMGHLILLVPLLLLLCAGLFVVREVQSHLDHRKQVLVQPLTDVDAQTLLSRCSILRDDRILDIRDIRTSSLERRRVDYEYRTAASARVSYGTAQFVWARGKWHAVLCR
jgi:hypothetical protein